MRFAEYYDISALMPEQTLTHCKPHEIVVIMGNLNIKIVVDKQGDVVGPFNVRVQDERLVNDLQESCKRRGYKKTD